MNTILNFIHTAENALLRSLRTATFCWMAAGLAIAILVARGVIKKKNGKKQDISYGLEGMSLGMCFGLLGGTMFEGYIGIGISIGMIAGLLSVCASRKSRRTRVDEAEVHNYLALGACCPFGCLQSKGI